MLLYKIDNISDCQFSLDGGETFEALNILPDSVELSAEVEKSNNHRDVYKSKECSFTGSFEINHGTFEQMMEQVSNNPSRWDLHYTVKVQNRRHKKRRINKKWAKRYGYKSVEKVIKGFAIDEQVRSM